ncbi:MAG: peroxidase-related enzyme [Dehalococcoidia bacterium]
MAHGGALREVSGDPALASQVMHDYTKADMDPQTRAMLDFAVLLTREPGSMREENIEELRQAGLTDEQVLSVVLITCHFNFMTRLADGLGVELDEGTEEWVKGWLTGPATEQVWLVVGHT